MDVENLTANTYFLGRAEYQLGPLATIEVDDDVYDIDDAVAQAINELDEEDLVTVTDPPAGYPRDVLEQGGDGLSEAEVQALIDAALDAYEPPETPGDGPTELDYTEFTDDVTISGTAAGTPTTIVTANAIAFDGSTRICVEFFAPIIQSPDTAQVILLLFEGSTDLGRIGQYAGDVDTTGSVRHGVLLRRFYTPTSGTKTLSVRGYRTVGNATVDVGVGGADTPLPGYIRITTA